jgi:tetratricopeptide (TPR) repeat protein
MPISNTQTIWHLPYQRNPFFTGREDVLTQLHRALEVGATVALSHPQGISGLGGIGKTQTALEYAYRYRNDYTAVLWLRADSITALTSSMIELAHVLELPERHEQDQEIIIEAVLRWLRLHPGWLLIYDNIDDFFIAEPFLPKAGAGHLLFTTRAYALGGLAQRLDIQKMEPEIGALLLLRRADLLTLQATLNMAKPDDRSMAQTISQELDGLPLALDQAGAYIKEAPCPLPEYLTRYQTRQNDLLRERGSFDQDYPASVATTWSLSFENVSQANPIATELLNFCAFLAPDAIPEKLLTVGAPHIGDVLSPIAMDPLQLDLACKEVLRFSLFQRGADQHVITMHRLVQSVLQKNLSEEKRALWQQRVVGAVSVTFPSVDYENWSDCQQLLPHAKVCAVWMKQLPLPSQQGASLLLRAGYYSHERAQEKEAASLLEQSLAVFKGIYGPNHHLVADTLNNLALVYRAQGKQKDAEDLLLQALSIDTHMQETHNKSARSLNNLANLYQEQNRYQEAEALFLQALEFDKQTYGSEHVEVATDLNNLALLYRIQGRYQEAEPLACQALAIKEKEHGYEHPATAKNINNLAALYYEQGRYEKAEPLYEQALAIRMQVYEADHPEVANSLNNLALLYEKQGKIAQAEAYFQQALAMKIAVYGEKHSTVANTQNNLAQLFQRQKNYSEAEKKFLQALETEEYIWVANHGSIARSLNNLAMLYYEQERYSEAEPLLQRALTIFENVHGADHITVADTYNNLALIYVAQERYAEAESSYSCAHSIYEHIYGPDDIVVANNFSSLGLVYLEQEKYQQAETCFRPALDIYEREYGQEHPIVAQNLNHLAIVFYLQGNFTGAEPLYVHVLDNFERLLGPEHLGVAQCLENLAALYADQTRYAEASPLYLRALQIYQQQLEPTHPQIKATSEAYQQCQKGI